MSAFGGMLFFRVGGGPNEAMAVTAGCKLFIRAASLGGAYSLYEHRGRWRARRPEHPRTYFVSVGLEHPDYLIDDLIEDLEQAMNWGCEQSAACGFCKILNYDRPFSRRLRPC
jgi:cystathionine gamma-synthase